MVEYFHDFYGCHATIRRKRDQTYSLTIRRSDGKLLYRSSYETYKGTRIAMGKWSDCWEKNTHAII